ncbi:hypothetical protein FGW37_17725 [Streptomyces rectiverticillatus]|uniref:hypothetical protein n=1 Tax=Streptomyces rectiverticillatus TaxID=173860 RepID=UPI0015C30AD3|nr:hypothetical protein [Streptomyces rectiverticillatus]QLE73181.1 hypothetical protein FGW37_17725 [Streptomyces rectiverticillatus]
MAASRPYRRRAAEAAARSTGVINSGHVTPGTAAASVRRVDRHAVPRRARQHQVFQLHRFFSG